MMLRLIVAGCVLVGAAMNAAAQATAPDTTHDARVDRPSRSGADPLTIPIRWPSAGGKVPVRVTPKRPMSWRIDHFNFVRYEPLVVVDAKEVPSYSLLEGLWSQVLSLGQVKAAAVGNAELLGDQPQFLKNLEQWRTNIASTAKSLQDRLDTITKSVALTAEDLAKIQRAANDSRTDANDLEGLRKGVEEQILKQYALLTANEVKAYNDAHKALPSLDTAAAKAADALKKAEEARSAAKTEDEKKKADAARKEAATADSAARARLLAAKATVERIGSARTLTASPIAEAYYARQLYDAQLVDHKAVQAQLAEFIRRADECTAGRSKPIETHKAGTIVTVTATVKALGESDEEKKNAAAAKPIVMSYYVESEMPLVFHAGVAYTNLKSFDYQAVQKGLTGDVFAQIRKPSESLDLSLYMTYLFTPIMDDWKGGLGLTIGTGLKDAGKKLMLGMTFKFSDRLLLTGGKFSQTVTDSAGALVGTSPKLFESIQRVQKWGWFVSFSAAPF